MNNSTTDPFGQIQQAEEAMQKKIEKEENQLKEKLESERIKLEKVLEEELDKAHEKEAQKLTKTKESAREDIKTELTQAESNAQNIRSHTQNNLSAATEKGTVVFEELINTL